MVSRKEKVGFDEFYAFNSTTISLFLQVMKGVSRNPKDDCKNKGGLKVHMLTDVHANTAVFAKISEAKMHDKKFLKHLNPTKGNMLFFDKAYNYYQQFADWTQEGVFFVCRLKDNAYTLIAHLLLNVIQTINKSKKAFSTIAALVRIHLISLLNLTWVVAEVPIIYARKAKTRAQARCN